MNEISFVELISNLHNAQTEKNIPLQIKCYINLGIFHYERDNFEKSKVSFENALILNETIPEVNYYLALIALHNEDTNLAKLYLEKELKNNPTNKDAKSILEKIKIDSNFPLITLTLLFLNTIVFIFTYPQISFLNTLKYTLNFHTINFANIITSIFFHVNLVHFAVNMIILMMFGIILEKHIGSIKYLLIYLTGGILGNLTQILFFKDSFILGASAALFAILGSLILINPLMELKIIGIIKAPLILIFGCFFAINSLLINYYQISQNTFITGELAHIIGFLIGMLITGIIYKESRNVFYNWIIIFLGAWIVEYSIVELISNLNSLFMIISQIIIICVGISIISISYILLKEETKIKR